MIRVVLTEDDLRIAERVGKERQKTFNRSGYYDKRCTYSGEDAHVQGAKTESAVAKGLGVRWDGEVFSLEEFLRNRQSYFDVGGEVEVRSTKYSNGRLIIKKHDKDDAPFVLVIVRGNNTYDLMGWCYGREGKRQEWWLEMGYGLPQYYVPQSELKPIEDLQELIIRKRAEKAGKSPPVVVDGVEL